MAVDLRVLDSTASVLLVRPFILDRTCRDEQFGFGYVPMDIEPDVAEFLGTEVSIPYSQTFHLHLQLQSVGSPLLLTAVSTLLSRRACKFPALLFTGSNIMISQISKTTCCACRKGTTEMPRTCYKNIHCRSGYF
jgi:hypothetical protein